MNLLVEEIKIEQIKALFFDKDAIVESPFPLYRMDTKSGRYYFDLKDEKPFWYQSMTTFLGGTHPTAPFLTEWIVKYGLAHSEHLKFLSAEYGTMYHGEAAKLTINGTYDLAKINDNIMDYIAVSKCDIKLNKHPEWLIGQWSTQLKKGLLSWAQFLIDYKIKPLAIEIVVGDRELRLAGAIDYVAKATIKGKEIIVIIDIKSGNIYQSHAEQLLGYQILFENTFNVKVEKLLNFRPKDFESYPTYEVKDQTNVYQKERFIYKAKGCGITDDFLKEQTIQKIKGVITLSEETTTNNIEVVSLKDAYGS